MPQRIEDFIWPTIEDAKNLQIPRVLFKQLTPIILTVSDSDLDEKKNQLNKLAEGNSFLAQLAKSTSDEIVSKIPDLLARYQPFVKEILKIMGIKDPSTEDVANMTESLQGLWLDVGAEGVTASMLQPLYEGIFIPFLKGDDAKDKAKIDAAKAKEKSLSQAIEDFISDPDKFITQDDILQLLKNEINPANKKEEKQLDQLAEALSKSLNQFLSDRGRAEFPPEIIFEAYEQAFGKSIAPELEEGILQGLKAKKTIEKIKTVFITPDEIIDRLNDVIPGLSDMRDQIEPQLIEVIRGDDGALKKNKEFIQRYIEGSILKIFIKIAESNKKKDQDILKVLTGKLKAIVPEQLNGKTAEEVASQMIDEVLEDVLGITSQKHLEGIPPALRKRIYKKIKVKAHQKLAPLLLPMIERSQNRVKLDKLSGSKFLGSLSEALSHDTFSLLPVSINSYRAIGDKYFTQLSGKQPSEDESKQVAKEIIALMELNKDEAIEADFLAKVYDKVIKSGLTKAEQKELIAKALKEILSVQATPEEIVKAIGEAMPSFDQAVLDSFAAELQGFIHDNQDAYQNITSFAQAYAEGVLLKIFIRVAEKNPPKGGKDTLVVLTEKVLDKVAEKSKEAKTRSPKDVAKELDDAIMQEFLGIDSSEAFAGLPDPIKVKVFDAVTGKLSGLLVGIQQSLAPFEKESESVERVREKSKQFGIDKKAAKSYAQIASEDIANYAMDAIPSRLTEMSGDKMRLVNKATKSINTLLENLAAGNMAVAKVLLNYSKGAQFQKMLGDRLTDVAGIEDEDKKKAADLVGNLILDPLNRVFENAVNFEKEHGAEFNQKLMANILVVAAGHLKNLNEAKAIAASAGRADILHSDYVAAAGGKLHPAVSVKVVTFEETLNSIENRIYKNLTDEEQKDNWIIEKESLRKAFKRLVSEENLGTNVLTMQNIIAEINEVNLKVTGAKLKTWQLKALKSLDAQKLSLINLIRKEAEAPSLHRQEGAYATASKTAMKLIFPKGKDDLKFVPENLRKQTWKIFETNLFSVILPMITEIVLDSDEINRRVLEALQSNIKSLNKPIDLSSDQEPKEPADLSLNALDEASGELISEMLKLMTLPLAKYVILDSKGNVTPYMKKTLGAILRKHLNGSFLKDKLKLVLEKMTVRDEDGNYTIKFDKTPKAEKLAKAEETRKTMPADLKRVSREVVNASISYAIRSGWARAQKRFDTLIENAFGKIGSKQKEALDAVFGFIFFKIVGTILSLLFYPTKVLMKEMIYYILALDENRDALLSIFTKVPADQPAADHAVYNEDLIYNLGRELKRTIEEALKEPILPLQKEAAL